MEKKTRYGTSTILKRFIKLKKMNKKTEMLLMIVVLAVFLFSCTTDKTSNSGRHSYNGSYTGEHLSRIAFPVGGLGAGMFCIEGTGYFSHMSVRNHPDLFNEPGMFAALSIKGVSNGARVLEGPVPEWRKFGMPMSGKGASGANYGLPRFQNATFQARFPFCNIILTDNNMPVKINISGWSPFIPGDADNSSLPAGVVEYTIENTGNTSIETVFSFHSPNFMKVREIIEGHINHRNGFNIRRVDKGVNSIKPMTNGFILSQAATDDEPFIQGDFAIFTDQENTVVDHCWYKGSLFDGSTLTWKAIREGRLQAVEPVESGASGASLFVPVTLEPGENKIIKVYMTWYVPDTDMRIGVWPDNVASTETYKPWYSSRFKDIKEVSQYIQVNYNDLLNKTKLFTEAFYNTTLPPEVIESVAANLTILKSTTVLRQQDGRLWGWEGSGDEWGSCYGSCTHVWSYAQAISHLFPTLERTLRETEYKVNQNEEGAQAFRTNLPISPPAGYFPASDGQMGGIMKMYRDWRISGNTEWMREMFPYVKKSMDCCIEIWDPKHNGYFEEPHHSTYDINFWGPNGMCTSYYLGALTAIIEMSKALDEPFDKYEALLEKGKKFVETELFNGEYFFQKIKWKDLVTENPENAIDESWPAVEAQRLKNEGPKHQYGNGCLSDGVIGMWMALVSGLEQVIDHDKIRDHLVSVHKYNLKSNLYTHVNPQRPGFAFGSDGGLLLCTWPKGGELTLPVIYSKEVWTGIEYQVAAHLMAMGEVEKGLDIVRACRDRYDGRIRNPFDEYECGHWYARAMSSYSLLQGMTGVRYDAVDSTLYIDSKTGDFTSFLSARSGFGNVGLKKGKPFLNVVYGNIDVKKFIVSGKEIPVQ